MKKSISIITVSFVSFLMFSCGNNSETKIKETVKEATKPTLSTDPKIDSTEKARKIEQEIKEHGHSHGEHGHNH
jgi:hypothetical protein